ncbi:hypothetical protein U1Q18_021177 [Sarracenia purpurea var. burkii]
MCDQVITTEEGCNVGDCESKRDSGIYDEEGFSGEAHWRHKRIRFYLGKSTIFRGFGLAKNSVLLTFGRLEESNGESKEKEIGDHLGKLSSVAHSQKGIEIPQFSASDWVIYVRL